MKTTQIIALAGFALLIVIATLAVRDWFTPAPVQPNLYTGEVTAKLDKFDLAGWWGTIYAAIQHQDLPKIREEFNDPTIQAYPFSVRHESFEIEGTAFGRNVVAVQIQRLKAIGTAAIEVTPKGDILLTPRDSSWTFSTTPDHVTIKKPRKFFLWAMVTGFQDQAIGHIAVQYKSFLVGPAIIAGTQDKPRIGLTLAVRW